MLVRLSLVALTFIGILATAFELATERHWNGIEQLIPWIALTVAFSKAALERFTQGLAAEVYQPPACSPCSSSVPPPTAYSTMYWSTTSPARWTNATPRAGTGFRPCSSGGWP